MKAHYIIALSILAAPPAFAADNGETLFKQNNCNACHASDKQMVGPSLKDIVAKYAEDKEARVKLEHKIRHGGSGSFGSMPMPATSRSVSDEQIKTMITWILEQK